jgi:hypothetical protein
MKIYSTICISLFLSIQIFSQYSIYEEINYDSVKFDITDFGTMWTFDDIPYEYFEKTYGFRPTDDWLERAQKSALQFGRGCSAAFVSGNGLIMTNHHCGRGSLKLVQNEGENLLRDGFYAELPADERRIPGLFVDQLISITDVTDNVNKAINMGESNTEKISLRDQKIEEVQSECEDDSIYHCRVVTLYKGGKYSLYKYRRYNDVRLVMTPDFQIAATGWDWDNFTYPRYELDFAFYRAYDEEGKPVKSDFHFTWSDKGAEEGEPIFVIGRPGGTDRLLSMAQLEYMRDKSYPYGLIYRNEVYKAMLEFYKQNPERESEMLHWVLSSGNGRKSYAGRLAGLRDEYLMRKKIDFENQLRERVETDDELSEKYGDLWDTIEESVEVLSETADEYFAYIRRYRSFPVYLKLAVDVVQYAEQIKLPEEQRFSKYKSENIEETRDNMFPEIKEPELQMLLVAAHANYLNKISASSNDDIIQCYKGLRGEKAIEYVMESSMLIDSVKFRNFITQDPDDILKSDDPYIKYVVKTKDRLEELSDRRSGADNSLKLLNQKLGELISDLYGNNIPPDATSSLRISDGVIKGYEYNGTIAPGKTTYYGLWDRYYSFDGNTYPWGLHERWKSPPPELDLSVPVCFASTNDIVGGNSGSSVINRNLEVVGLVHDGNLESLAGHFLFLPENNRTVATDSWGLIEALKYIYKTDRLIQELLSGKAR